jgi:hypothetical protein
MVREVPRSLIQLSVSVNDRRDRVSVQPLKFPIRRIVYQPPDLEKSQRIALLGFTRIIIRFASKVLKNLST